MKFNQLDLGDKADTLWPDAEFIDHRFNEKSMVCIYKLHDFFVEVHFNIQSKDIIKILAIDSERDWEDYLGSISLDELMN